MNEYEIEGIIIKARSFKEALELYDAMYLFNNISKNEKDDKDDGKSNDI